MQMLSACLWKEWRELRHLIIGLVLFPPLVSLMIWLLGGKHAAASPMVVLWLTATATVAAVVILSTELIAGEARCKRMDFLARQPVGLALVFRVKLGLLAAAVLAVFLSALTGTSLVTSLAGGPGWMEGVSSVLGNLLSGNSGGQNWVMGNLLLKRSLFQAAAYVILVGTIWLLALSTWFPQPGSALLATMVLVGSGCLTANTFIRPLMWRKESWAVYFFLLGAPVAAGLFAARLSFVRGYRFGMSPLRAAGWGLPCLGVLVLLVGGGWAWPRHSRVADPGDPDFRISGALLGTAGRLVFINAEQRNPLDTEERRLYRLLLDTETGRWRQGGVGAWGDVGDLKGVDRIEVDPFVQHSLIVELGLPHLLLDGRTGELLGTLACNGSTCSYPAILRNRVRQAVRQLSPLHLDHGGKAWFLDGQLECDGPGGSVQALPWEGKAVLLSPTPAGFNYRIPVFPLPDLRSGHREYVLAPGMQAASALAESWLSPEEGLGPRLEGGNWLVLERGKGLRNLLEPVKGVRTPIRFSDSSVVGWAVEDLLYCPTPSGTAVIGLWRESWKIRERAFARFDADGRTLLSTPPMVARPVGCLDEDRILVHTDRGLWVLRFGRPGRERIFPREGA